MSSRIVFLVWSLMVFSVAALSSRDPFAEGASGAAASDPIRRGEFLVRFGGCSDCHTPKVFTDRGPEPDMSKLLSGHPEGSRLPLLDATRISNDGWLLFNNQLTAAVGPWGISFAANLTSDDETGIGRWTEEAFVATMRTGEHWGVGPRIMPPMPWQNLAQLPDEDLKAIFVYLKSTPPVRNHVPAAMTLQEYLSKVQPDGSLPRP